MKPITRLGRPYLSAIEEAVRRLIVGQIDPEAYAFYARLMAGGFAPNKHIEVLPEQRIIYICVPKNASSRIKMTLGALLGNFLTSELEANQRKLSGLKSPKQVGLTKFRRIATDTGTLRFSFVRNPYARLVSCWVDKFRDRPLTLNYPSVYTYLAWRQENDPSLPEGATSTLCFEEFANFAATTALERVDPHWNVQADILDMPGIELNLVGRVESFEKDFMRVLDYAHANDTLRAEAVKLVNASDNMEWTRYYTNELADRVYKAYELDFDRFQYPRKLQT